MTKHGQYKITFLKNTTPAGAIRHFAKATNSQYNDIANHLTYSDYDNTNGQISGIDKAVSRFSSGLKVNNFWGEVFGSSLHIYPDQSKVEINDGDTVVPLQDFRQLLQEWLTFLNS